MYDDDADPTWQLLSTEHVIDKDEDGNPTVSDLTAYTYETNGQIDTVQDPMGRTWSYDYGTYGNLAAVYEPGIVNPATILHDSFGNAETVADQEGRQVITYYDQQNRPTSVIRVTEDDWETRTIDYDLVPADGCPDVRCTRITDELGGQFWFAFDELGRLTSTEDATEGIEAYQYNGEGQLQQYTDRSGSYTTFSYDSAGRLDGRSVFDPGDNLEASYSTGYDADGNVISLVEEDAVGAPVRELTWTYDAAGRVTTASATGDELVDWSFTYDYNNRGQLDLRTGAGDALDYQYDAERFQVDKTELDSNSSHAVNLSWDITGRLDEAWTSNDLHNDFAWTPAGHLDSILHRKLSTSATPFRTLEYDTDSSGAIIALDDDGEGPLGFDLDDAWRLEDIGPPESAPVLSYWYDAIGNRITGDDDDSAGDDDDSASEYEYDASHRMYESPDASFLFDETGNVVQRIDKLTGQVHDYVWNAQGQLESVEVYDVGDVLLLTADFVYDPIGRRVATYVANYVTGFVEDDFFVYEGGHIESTYTAEDDPSSQTARYLYGPAVDMPLARVEPDGDYFGYLLDASGTVREVRDSANVNAVAASYVLDPWGNAIDIDESGLEQPFRFHGRPFVDLDPTSGEFPLYDFRARWYDPVSGRFLSEDPLWPFEPHPYAFADNNPIQFGDPSGQCVKGRLAVGALGAIAVGVTDAAATVIKSLDSLNDWVALNKCMSGGEAYQAWANDNLAMTQNGLRNAVTAAVFGGVGGPGCGRSEFKATKVCRCRCGNSVAEGTLVDTAEGLRPIETLEPGDLVWTRRDDPLNPGEFLAPVAGVWRGQGAEIVRVMVGGDELLLTPDHPVWTEANGWVHADALGPDDSLVMAGGLPVRVTAVAPESGAVPVYNLAVEEGETFFVGESRTWVHNCPPGVAAAIARHGGREVDGGYMFPNRRAARAAASEVAGDLGSTPATTRKSDFRGGPWSWRDSPGVIGKQNQPGKASSRGWRDDPIGHPRHDMGPHVNVWNDGWGSHFFYPGGG